MEFSSQKRAELLLSCVCRAQTSLLLTLSLFLSICLTFLCRSLSSLLPLLQNPLPHSSPSFFFFPVFICSFSSSVLHLHPSVSTLLFSLSLTSFIYSLSFVYSFLPPSLSLSPVLQLPDQCGAAHLCLPAADHGLCLHGGGTEPLGESDPRRLHRSLPRAAHRQAQGNELSGAHRLIGPDDVSLQSGCLSEVFRHVLAV